MISTVKEALGPVPQPLKTYIARCILCICAPVLVPIIYVAELAIEARDLGQSIWGEFLIMWDECRHW